MPPKKEEPPPEEVSEARIVGPGECARRTKHWSKHETLIFFFDQMPAYVNEQRYARASPVRHIFDKRPSAGELDDNGQPRPQDVLELVRRNDRCSGRRLVWRAREGGR